MSMRTDPGPVSRGRGGAVRCRGSGSAKTDAERRCVRWRHGGTRPAPGRAAGRGRTDELHRPGQGDRAVHVGGAPARPPAGGARGDPRVPRRRRRRGGGTSADRVRLPAPAGPICARRHPGPAQGSARDRGLLLGCRGLRLRGLGPGRDAAAPRRPHRADPRSRATCRPGPPSCSPHPGKAARSSPRTTSPPADASAQATSCPSARGSGRSSGGGSARGSAGAARPRTPQPRG